MRTHYKEANKIIDALNAYMKRTKGITSVKVSEYWNLIHIDVWAPMSHGKVYNEMVSYLKTVMYSCEEDSNADWWCSHEDYLVDNNLVPETEAIIEVCVYHRAK